MRVKKFTLIFFPSFIVKWIPDMKKLTLALVLTLCSARVYGQLPQDVTVKPEDIAAAQTLIETTFNDTLKDPKILETVSEQLNVSQTEVKNWFSNHKIATTILVTYATCLGLTAWAHYVGSHKAKCENNVVTFPEEASSFRKFCGNKLMYSAYPLVLANNHKMTTAALILAAIIAWEVYQGKDSAAAAFYNKLFGKKEVVPATSEVVAAEEAAKAEVAPATTEVVAPTVA
jgi:hypothetical protein